MGIIKGTGSFFFRTLGGESLVNNSKASMGRIKNNLSFAKGMISSLSKEEQGEEVHIGQFVKLDKLSQEQRVEWEKMAKTELALWLAVVLMLFVYIYYYSLNFSVILVLLAIVARATLVGTHVHQAIEYRALQRNKKKAADTPL